MSGTPRARPSVASINTLRALLAAGGIGTGPDIQRHCNLRRKAAEWRIKTLLRAGLVEPIGRRIVPKAGKPAIIYRVTPAGHEAIANEECLGPRDTMSKPSLPTKPAICMTCGGKYRSQGPHNRMCDPCRKNDGAEEYSLVGLSLR